MGDNVEIRRKKKWKEIKYLYSLLQSPKYSHGSIENALWFYGNSTISSLVFIQAMINEYKFERELCIDNNLRILYSSFDGGTQDLVDWREILITFKIIVFFRFVRNRPDDLLLMLFDILAYNKDDAKDGQRGDPDKNWYEYQRNSLSFLLICCFFIGIFQIGKLI